MELVTRAIGPLQTNVCLVGDPRTHEAIVIDGAIPGLAWVVEQLTRRAWRLLLIVSTHGHWDHTGENAALQAWSREQAPDGLGARIAAHRADWHHLTDPEPLFAPFPVPPCVPAVELAEGGALRFGDVRLDVLHTPGHTEGSVCLLSRDDGILFAGDTLFAGGWGRVDLLGGDPDAMVASLTRLSGLDGTLRVVPGHGRETTIARERPLLELVAKECRLPA
jgi:glyoxylase-like metal-dependent hydrolase (beta-lactamase superfamily II)